MTTHHTPAPAAPVTGLTARPAAADDQALANRCQSSGDYLAGLIAAGTLEAAGTVRRLPADLFPDYDPVMVEAVWQAALPVGFRAGQLSVRPSWTPDALNRLRAELANAGYTAMGNLAARSAAIHPPQHPADDEPLDHATGVRDGGHP
ncbi:hypothetical protein [Streptomyces sp. NPDC048157]|uniref:hypothetical protein n=1 Tax=Streptomyces sp. NPDC048157 TaxID=3365503 RepID=UPI00371C932D